MTIPAICLALDVRSVLARPLSELRGFTDPAGRRLSPRQVRDALQQQLAGGNELLPVGRAAPFDFNKQ